MEAYTRIFIEDMQVTMSVGYADWERHPDRPTVLQVSADLFADVTEWHIRGREDVIDYSRVHTYLKGWSDRPHVDSLEELCEDFLAFCFTDPRVRACRIRVRKPHIFADAAGAGVEILRRAPAG